MTAIKNTWYYCHRKFAKMYTQANQELKTYGKVKNPEQCGINARQLYINHLKRIQAFGELCNIENIEELTNY